MEMPDEQKRMIDRAMFLRGRMITHFATCEYLLADISVRVDRRFVHLLKKRVKAVKKITAENARYSRYPTELGLSRQSKSARCDRSRPVLANRETAFGRSFCLRPIPYYSGHVA